MESAHAIRSVGHDVVFGNAEKILVDYLSGNPDKKAVVIADENTLKHCWSALVSKAPSLSAIEVITIDSGEQNKNIAVASVIWKKFSDMRLSRNDVVINLGGGVVTDLGGFVAASFKRGVNFIQVPTSLLAMVDASVGGKVGVDLDGLKNLVGSFATPEMVIIDTSFLDTLPQRQIVCGYAEILKHGLILDKAYWQKTISGSVEDLDHVKSLVVRSVELKNQVVVTDFKEKGDRKKLNFGHTIGHALETYFLNSDVELLHGEAVAVGMMVESYLSVAAGLLSAGDFDEIKSEIQELEETLKL